MTMLRGAETLAESGMMFFTRDPAGMASNSNWGRRLLASGCGKKAPGPATANPRDKRGALPHYARPRVGGGDSG